MAKDKTIELSIKIAGQVDKSLQTAIRQATGQVASLTSAMSGIGKAGLVAMSAFTVAATAGLANCTKEAMNLESQMADVVKYVDGLADANGKVSDSVAENGKTFAQNYGQMKDVIQELSTQIPMTTEEITKMAAAAGQSGKSMGDLVQYSADGSITGFLKDVAMMATAMDIDAEQAGSWAAKWEKAFNMNHEEVMVLSDQINYLGANSATTAAEIASVVNDAASLGQIAGVSASTTAALADAVLAMGIDSGSAATSVRRMITNMSLGESATKAQQTAWEQLGFTAQGVASSMQEDSVGTMKSIFEAINKLDADKQVGVLKSLFGQWSIEGAAKLTGNLEAFTDALAMVDDPSLFDGSMAREYIIKADTAENLGIRVSNAFARMKANIGDDFLPVLKELGFLGVDVLNGITAHLPDLQGLAMSALPVLRSAVETLGTALINVMPYVQQFFDYVATHGETVAKIVAGMAGTFATMTFAPQIAGVAGGVGSLLFGSGAASAAGEAGAAGAAGGAATGGGVTGLLGRLWNGGQTAGNAVAGVATALPGLATSTAAAAPGNGGVLKTLWAGAKNMVSGAGVAGTTELMQAAAANPGLLASMPTVGSMVSGTGIGQYLGGIGGAAKNLANTKIGGGIVGAAKGTGRVSLEILKGISDATGLTGAVNGVKGGAANIAGWAGGKATGALSAVANSGIGQAVGGAAAKALPVLGGIGGNAASFAGAGAGLLGSVWGPIAGGFGSLLAGAAPVVLAISGIIAVISILGDHMSDLEPIVQSVFGDSGLAVFQTFEAKLTEVGSFMTGLFNGGVADALSGLKDKFSTALGGGGLLSTLFGGQENGLAAFDGLTQIIQSIMGVVGQLVAFATGTVKPIIQDIFGFIVTTVVPGIVGIFATSAPFISDIITGLGTAIMTAMQTAGTVIQAILPIVAGLVTAFMNIASVVVPVVLGAISVFAGGISAVMTNIQGIFSGLIEFITGVFAGNWQQAWDGVKQIFGNAFDALVNLCKTPINAVISLINSAIGGINEIVGNGVTIPDWVPDWAGGGKTFSMKLPTIPMLANGGFTSGVSIAGEAGREAVISFKPGVRSENIDTWQKAGQMLGATNEVELAPIAGQPGAGSIYNNSSTSMGNVSFSPNITIQGNADRSVLDDALAQAHSQFESWMAEYQRRQARLAY